MSANTAAVTSSATQVSLVNAHEIIDKGNVVESYGIIFISLITRRAACFFGAILHSLLLVTAENVDHDCVPGVIETTSGKYIGHAAIGYPNVTEYLGIAYAQPPVGNLRFAAPSSLKSSETFNTNAQPYDCPYVAQPWGSLPSEYWSHADRIMAQESANGYNAMNEDCLKLNIWTPSGSKKAKSVMVWLYGGGFDRGSVNNPAYIGSKMAAAEDVIVVSFNYRVNIMGFANAPGASNNVALRDARLAIEWVRDNIHAFGGNASSITLFGQSQGAYLISYYAYAFYQDPIAHAFIQQSGSAFSPVTGTTQNKTALWRNVSATVGCNQTTDDSILSCMRGQDLSTVLRAWKAAPPSTTGGAPFGPVIDNELIFANYTQRNLDREVSNMPLLLGANNNEAGFYVFRYAVNGEIINQTTQNLIGFGTFACPVAVEAEARSAIGNLVYRYEYEGDWENLRLYNASRAYHTSETAIVFGTMDDLSGESSRPLEEAVSQYMQHAWASFGKDPINGLKELGWPAYNQSSDTLIRLGYAQDTTASYVSPSTFDAICPAVEKELSDTN